ncbi:hypothetical protein D3C87_2056470 [compost metagenome]
MVGHGVLIDLSGGAFLRPQTAGEIAEVVDRQRNVRVQRFADRFAVVPAFGQCQQFEL